MEQHLGRWKLDYLIDPILQLSENQTDFMAAKREWELVYQTVEPGSCMRSLDQEAEPHKKQN